MNTETSCPGCGDAIDRPICLLESFERFGAVLCDPCFERRCQPLQHYPIDDGSPDDWADIIPY